MTDAFMVIWTAGYVKIWQNQEPPTGSSHRLVEFVYIVRFDFVFPSLVMFINIFGSFYWVW